jgi:hypothetical protein
VRASHDKLSARTSLLGSHYSKFLTGESLPKVPVPPFVGTEHEFTAEMSMRLTSKGAVDLVRR